MSTPRKILKGFFYTLGSGYAARAFSVVLTLFIRRALEPGVFADVVLGVTLFALLASLREFGLHHALLHYQERVEEFVGTLFILNLGISVLAALLGSGLVLGLVRLFPQDFSWTVGGVVWVFWALHLLRQATVPSEALLRMDFEFGRLALFHGLGTVLALGGALLGARAGWGAQSLILGGWSTFSVFSMVYVLFFSTAAWGSRPLRLRPLRFDRVWARRLLQYGLWYWGGWIAQSFVLWYDKLIVALVVGKTSAALYENALWLVQLPTAVISHIIFAYTNALYSRYRRRRRELSDFFARILSLVVRVAWPLALVLVWGAGELMHLLREQWAASAPMVVWLAGFAFLRPLLDEGHGLLWALGETRTSSRIAGLQAGVALVLIPGAALRWGVEGVAWSVGAVAAVGALGLGLGVRPYVRVAWAQVFGAPAAGLALAAAAGLLYGHWAFGIPLVDFVLRSGVMLGIYAGVLWLLEGRVLRENLAQVRRLLRARGE